MWHLFQHELEITPLLRLCSGCGNGKYDRAALCIVAEILTSLWSSDDLHEA